MSGILLNVVIHIKLVHKIHEKHNCELAEDFYYIQLEEKTEEKDEENLKINRVKLLNLQKKKKKIKAYFVLKAFSSKERQL